jgi:hypothetical protein
VGSLWKEVKCLIVLILEGILTLTIRFPIALVYRTRELIVGLVKGSIKAITEATPTKAKAKRRMWSIAIATALILIAITFRWEYTAYIPKSYRWTYKGVVWKRTERARDTANLAIDKWNYAVHRVDPEGSMNTLQVLSAMCFSSSSEGDPDKEMDGKERETTYDIDSVQVGIDNRCSGCISHVSSDFVGVLKRSDKCIRGFGGTTTRRVMTGTLRWRWTDDEGKVHRFLVPNSYYVPQGGVRLLSPQHWAQTRPTRAKRINAGEFTGADSCTLRWGSKRQHTKVVPLDKKGANLATMWLAPGYSDFTAFCTEIGIQEGVSNDILYDMSPLTVKEAVQVSDDEESDNEGDDFDELDDVGAEGSDENGELPTKQREFSLGGPSTEEQKGRAPVVIVDEEDRESQGELTPTTELLLWHYKYSHIGFAKLQEMAKQGILPRRLAKCNVPVCSACMYAKATKRPWRSKTRKNEHDPDKPPKPGDVVSVDQLVSPVPGLIAQMTGFVTKQRYRYATVFVDQASKLGFVYLQASATAEETVRAKTAFERYSAHRGVTIRAYHADNGIFKANGWVNECKSKGQPLTFAGVNAHHQNGLAERRIRELQELARTQLVHASRRWPKAVTANLWPYALRMACMVHNASPNMQDKRRRSPQQIFNDDDTTNINRKHWKPFGCPVYVLDADLQEGKTGHGKWKDRSRMGIYLGQSPIHNHSVALVLSMKTGYVSPQFHVKFDTSFHTVKQQPNLESNWLDATGFRDEANSRRKKRTKEAPATKKKKRDDRQQPNTKKRKTTVRFGEASQAPEGGRDTAPKHDETTENQAQTEQATQQQAAQVPATDQEVRTEAEALPRMIEKSGREPDRTEPQLERTRSGRVVKPLNRLIQEAMVTEISKRTAHGIEGEIFCLETICPEETACETNSNPLQVFKASTDPDTMYMHEAMREPDHKEFIKAMEKEVQDQMENGNFTIIHKSEMPEGSTLLPAVWQMKRKRDIITREVKKYKARLNIDGSKMQYGVHYEQTYAPVASWMSVKLLLALTVLRGWHTTQIDYVLAFPQAPVEKELYMKIPKGFKIGGVPDPREYVLKLHRNIYGQKQAGRVWNKYLVERLVKKVGFKQSKFDECVFYKGNVIYVLYTDDSILAGPDKREIEAIIMQIKQAGLDITVEGDIKDFLGVNIVKDEEQVTFTQPHLIDKILSALRMDNDNVKTKETPAASSVLVSRHTGSPEFNHSFNYRSVIGMLGYLETTRSDISYATHQCARFSSDPKSEHEKAVRWIGRYLKGTRDKGMTFTPDESKGLEVHVDADFSGNWDSQEAASDRDTARSRHGYIISYAGCPIVTKSQLQQEIALSTTESEYTGLSYALREAIPIIRLLDEMKEEGFPITSTEAKIHCKVFEDNSGALEIARNPKYRPRTKHLNCRLHHFRSWVESKRISIHKIASKDQLADYLTKAVPLHILLPLRKKVMGW